MNTAAIARPPMQIRSLYIPAGLVDALARKAWQYTHVNTILQTIATGDLVIGVAGDPGNASYEWFAWDCARNALADRSDDGWGSAAGALRFALNKFDI